MELALIGGHGGVEGMQVINREVFRWDFMALFLGTAANSLAIAGYGAFRVSGPAGTLIMLAGLTYLIGCFGVTVFCNVPMNEALAGMEMSSDITRDYRLQIYVPRWTFWNSVRTIACVVSAALLLCGILWITLAQSPPV
ncbi:anthrone oxygenase family protein [Gymnodinialimonas ulvae]|uniref:anthrone oxygenase family protein n=1 Tax=Gymnodinialimonas ulvae TaxID=3126504 RepID=UPI003098E1EE